MIKLFSFILLIFIFQIHAGEVYLKSGTVIKMEKIVKDETDFIQVRDKDENLIQINKKNIEKIILNDVQVSQPKKLTEDFKFSQHITNDFNFRGISMYGEPLIQRNSQSYRSLNQAYHIKSSLEYDTPINGLKFLINVYNPTVGRTNKDSDLYLQTSPGGSDRSSDFLYYGLVYSGGTFIKPRKEKNALKDIIDLNLTYEWKTKMGTISTGFFVLQKIDDVSFKDFLFGVKFPFLEIINPTLMSYFRSSDSLTSSSSHHRLSFEHTFANDKFKFTPRLEAGYQYGTTYSLLGHGVSDITSKFTFIFSNFFLGFNWINRPNANLYDTDSQYSSYNISNYSTSYVNTHDGKIISPSTQAGVYKYPYYSRRSNSAAETLDSYYRYQASHTDIIRNIFIIQFGYTLKF